VNDEQFEFCIAYPAGLGIGSMLQALLIGPTLKAQVRHRIMQWEYYGASFLGPSEQIANSRAIVNNFFDQIKIQHV